MKKVIFLIVCIVFSNASFSSEREEALKVIEQQFLKNIKEHSVSKVDQFHLYNLAGRELYAYDFYKESKKYYEKAISLKTKEDHSEIYINLIAIDHATLGKVEKGSYERAMKYFKESGNIKKQSISRYMKFINSSFIDKSAPKEFKGYFGQYAIDISLKDLIISKKYKKALSLLNEKNMVGRDINTQLTYDILKALNFPKNKSKPFCSYDIENDSPFSWITKTCKSLLKYQEGSRPSASAIKSIKVSMKKTNNENRLYLVNALGDLK